jgi:phage shock protein A
MSESIFLRVQRVVSGSVESAIDKAEQWTSGSLARQALRDMDGAIAKARDEVDAALMRRLETEQQLGGQRKELVRLKEQARFALGEGRDDLAEAAVARQIEAERQIGRLTEALGAARIEEARLAESLASLGLRREQMEQQLDGFQSAKRAAQASPEAPPSSRSERKAQRAEAALQRAITAAGGTPPVRQEIDSAAKLAEIARLEKDAAVAERLAALRAVAERPVEAAKPRTRQKRARG